MTDKNKMMHLGTTKGSISKYVIVPSSHEWVDRISQFLNSVEEISHFREFKTINGYYKNNLISVCSTGNGGESSAIAIEELYQCGARYFIRIGTTNALLDNVEESKIILIQGVSNNDGVSKHYIPAEYPTIASVNLLMKAEDACKELKKDYLIGTCLTPTCFFNFEKEKNALDLCLDINCGSIYASAISLGLDAITILISVNQISSIDIQGVDENAEKEIIEVALKTLNKIIEEDGNES